MTVRATPEGLFKTSFVRSGCLTFERFSTRSYLLTQARVPTVVILLLNLVWYTSPERCRFAA